MKTLAISLLSGAALFMAGCAKNQSVSIHYPEPRPDSVALRFLPGLVSTDSLDFNATFSNNGDIFYFSHGKKGGYDIYEIHLNENPLKAMKSSFSEDQYAQADPFMAHDGTLYYISNRPQNDRDTLPDYNIWRISPRSHGTWSAPQFVDGVNTDSTEYYVSLAANGNLYFASTRAGGQGGLDLYVSKLVDGKYATPENLGPAINTAGDEHDALVTDREEYIIFAGSERADSFGEADLYYAKRTDEGWQAAKNMGPTFNTTTYEYCPNFSPDHNYFFFSSELDVKWIDARLLPFRLDE
jgi:hypothetical protein